MTGAKIDTMEDIRFQPTAIVFTTKPYVICPICIEQNDTIMVKIFRSTKEVFLSGRPLANVLGQSNNSLDNLPTHVKGPVTFPLLPSPINS